MLRIGLFDQCAMLAVILVAVWSPTCCPPPRDDRGLILLSAPQREIWLDQKINPSTHPYHVVEYIEINGPVDPQLFERALRQVVSETEAI